MKHGSQHCRTYIPLQRSAPAGSYVDQYQRARPVSCHLVRQLTQRTCRTRRLATCLGQHGRAQPIHARIKQPNLGPDATVDGGAVGQGHANGGHTPAHPVAERFEQTDRHTAQQTNLDALHQANHKAHRPGKQIGAKGGRPGQAANDAQIEHGGDGGDQHGSQGGPRYVVEVGRQHAEREQGEQGGVEAGERGADAAGMADGGPGERPGGRHGPKARTDHIAQPESEQFLRGVDHSIGRSTFARTATSGTSTSPLPSSTSICGKVTVVPFTVTSRTGHSKAGMPGSILPDRRKGAVALPPSVLLVTRWWASSADSSTTSAFRESDTYQRARCTGLLRVAGTRRGRYCKASSSTMHPIPSSVSPAALSASRDTTLQTVAKKPPSTVRGSPSRLPSWAPMMMRAVADVNADVTGTEMKQTRNPSRKAPIASSTRPAANASTITYWTGRPAVYSSVSSDIRLVGPIDTSRTVPQNTYTSDPVRERATRCLRRQCLRRAQVHRRGYLPMKAAYSPYWDGRPAIVAYAMLCGIIVSPSVTPAIRSDRASAPSYFRIQVRIGRRLLGSKPSSNVPQRVLFVVV
uniref:Uncharacterized protein n=1 Tax=Anopheles merus TaxID=30066 RepID=A0A182UTJ6_ANOME